MYNFCWASCKGIWSWPSPSMNISYSVPDNILRNKNGPTVFFGMSHVLWKLLSKIRQKYCHLARGERWNDTFSTNPYYQVTMLEPRHYCKWEAQLHTQPAWCRSTRDWVANIHRWWWPWPNALTGGSTKIVQHEYRQRHAHKHWCTILPLYSKIQVLSGITSCRLMEDNKLQVDFIDLLMNDMPKDAMDN